MAKQTPMMRQYLEIKAQHPEEILFFRLGDFYEMFLDDAVVASRVLGITLTARNKGAEEEIPLCGIPYHSSQQYIAKLIEAGHKVAICEQVEDPKEVKGLVKREVVRIITPGLVTDTDTLEPKENNFLLSVAPNCGRSWGLACVDITTGEFRISEVDGFDMVESQIASVDPREMLLTEGEVGDDLLRELGPLGSGRMVNRLPEWVFDQEPATRLLKDHFAVATLDAFGCKADSMALRAAGSLLHYLRQTQKDDLTHLRPPIHAQTSQFMVLDESTRRNLELIATLQNGRKKGSLLGIMDRTLTAMGGRLMRQWIQFPLVDVAAIHRRHEAVEQLVEEGLLRADLRDGLDGVYDLERLNGKIAMAHANAKDLVALQASLEKLPSILGGLEPFGSPLLQAIADRIDPLPELAALIERSIVPDPPFILREGGLIRDGYHEELDELRSISREGKGWIARLEQEQKDRTGIANLKVKYNKVFGYFIEVTKSQLDRVPEDYDRKQTLTNAERFITPALKDYEAKVLGAEERITDLEYDLFQQVRQDALSQGERIARTAQALAELDVLLSLAELAQDRTYVRPTIDDSGLLEIEDGRHPVIEAMDLGEPFVPNDTRMTPDKDQLHIITGPNMAGKSTYMRQVALITLMAQMGSFVPAKMAHVGVVDRIFTRVGASDNLARGQSTFMVEMSETAHILNHATDRSLIVLDEIGRGTSTFDGVSIAWAVAEYLHDNAPVAAKTLFATHYHELTDLALTRERVCNFNIAVKEWNDRIIFLRKIVVGGASRSYGIQVGRLAGLPQQVIDRAKEILHNLEAGELSSAGKPRLAAGDSHPQPVSDQMSLFQAGPDPIRQHLEALDISGMTPLDALNTLDQLKKKLL